MDGQIDGPYVVARMSPSRLRRQEGNSYPGDHCDPA
jgi:hypothetical protein